MRGQACVWPWRPWEVQVLHPRGRTHCIRQIYACPYTRHSPLSGSHNNIHMCTHRMVQYTEGVNCSDPLCTCALASGSSRAIAYRPQGKTLMGLPHTAKVIIGPLPTTTNTGGPWGPGGNGQFTPTFSYAPSFVSYDMVHLRTVSAVIARAQSASVSVTSLKTTSENCLLTPKLKLLSDETIELCN